MVCFYDPQEDQGLRTETRKEAKEPGTSQTATTGQDGVPTEFPASQRFQEHLQSSVRLHGPAHRSGIPNSCRCGLWLPAPGANAAVDGSRSKDQESNQQNSHAEVLDLLHNEVKVLKFQSAMDLMMKQRQVKGDLVPVNSESDSEGTTVIISL